MGFKLAFNGLIQTTQFYITSLRSIAILPFHLCLGLPNGLFSSSILFSLVCVTHTVHLIILISSWPQKYGDLFQHLICQLPSRRWVCNVTVSFPLSYRKFNNIAWALIRVTKLHKSSSSKDLKILLAQSKQRDLLQRTYGHDFDSITLNAVDDSVVHNFH